MTDFIQNYGAVIASIISAIATLGILIVATKAQNEWKKQKRIEIAEKYHDATWEKMNTNPQYIKKIIIKAIINQVDITNSQEILDEAMANLTQGNKELLRMRVIFPELEEELQKIENIPKVLTGELSKIMFYFMLKLNPTNGDRVDAAKKIEEVFNNTGEMKKFNAAHKKIIAHLIQYIGSELKK